MLCNSIKYLNNLSIFFQEMMNMLKAVRWPPDVYSLLILIQYPQMSFIKLGLEIAFMTNTILRLLYIKGHYPKQ